MSNRNPEETNTTRSEQSRAVYPHTTGTIDREGVSIFYEVYGHGDKTILLMPTWTFSFSRVWKAQIGHLSRSYRVVTFDPRGNGASGRPERREDYTEELFMGDAIAVLDETATDAALVVAISTGAQRAMLLAAEHPERVSGLVLEGPYFLGTRRFEALIKLAYATFDRLPAVIGAQLKWNGGFIKSNPDAFIDWFTTQLFNMPHSTKQIEDADSWARTTNGNAIAESWVADLATPISRKEQIALAKRIRCPVLIVHGEGDAVTPLSEAKVLAAHTHAEVARIPGGGHMASCRKPAEFNRVLSDFCVRILGPGHQQPKLTPRSSGRRRALFVSSPIGLGHACRDLAISRALREQVPDLDVHWLSQHPVTAMLEREHEQVHPASKNLALESVHIESESAEHDLHCFQAWRRMDEILIHNFGVFSDLMDSGNYDVVVGDEAWDIDYFTHEHPRLKKAPFVWLTDFVGWLPMPDGGERESFLTRDYNAEMLGHIARHPEVRDRAIFVGNPDDIGEMSFGQDLPQIREWTMQHYDFSGYITGFDHAALSDTAALRDELGYRDDERVCIVTVGGSAVGIPLLKKIIDAYPLAKRKVPNLRMIVVAGPRIDPASLPSRPGLEIRPYVHALYRHLAACDLAIIQGGLTTAMELAATGRPFIFVPLRHHFEQQYWVRHRLERYRAGRHMDFDDISADSMAEAISAEIGVSTNYRPVETDGADRAAAMIADLL